MPDAPAACLSSHVANVSLTALGRSVAAALLAAGTVAAGACASGGGGLKLEVTKVDASVRPPANVALYLKIAQDSGAPVALVPGDFAVYEDGKLVSVKKGKRALLPVKEAVDRLMLLAIDYTGPLVDSEYLPILLEALDGFEGRMIKHVRLGVSVFDGEGLNPFVGFDDADPKSGMAGLRKFRPRGRNVDLWGSFMGALDALEEAAAKSPLRHRQPILVIVTDRKDKVARHTVDEVRARVKKSAADVYVIGVGDGVSKEDLESLGKTGSLFAAHPSEVDKPFDALAEKLEAKLGQDYLFAYCSPKRKGKHEVEVRIVSPRYHGAVEHEFSAKGFTKSCNPTEAPDFAAESAAPAGGEEGAAAEEDEGKSKKKKKVEEEESAAKDES